jgi:hypothetical protein
MARQQSSSFSIVEHKYVLVSINFENLHSPIATDTGNVSKICKAMDSLVQSHLHLLQMLRVHKGVNNVLGYHQPQLILTLIHGPFQFR